jgi:hypothetical protein
MLLYLTRRFDAKYPITNHTIFDDKELHVRPKSLTRTAQFAVRSSTRTPDSTSIPYNHYLILTLVDGFRLADTYILKHSTKGLTFTKVETLTPQTKSSFSRSVSRGQYSTR